MIRCESILTSLLQPSIWFAICPLAIGQKDANHAALYDGRTDFLELGVRVIDLQGEQLGQPVQVMELAMQLWIRRAGLDSLTFGRCY